MTNVTNYILDPDYYFNNQYTLNYYTKINIQLNTTIITNYNIISSLLDIINNYGELTGVDLYTIHEWIDKLYIPLSKIDGAGTSDLDINYLVTFNNWFIIK
jgi:hypothetical protein